MSSPLHQSYVCAVDAVWRADQLGVVHGATIATGFPALDSQLPGGGWPVGAINEVLQAQFAHHEWRLLLPALKCLTEGPVVLVGAPYAPFAPGLAARDFDVRRLLMIDAATPIARLWAAEQALRCSAVTAVLAWLPQVRPEQLRRLQIAAQTHSKLLFVLRPAQARAESSPAALRLLASMQPESDVIQVHILKRRGPPLDQPLVLSAGNAHMGVVMVATGDGNALDCLAAVA